MFGLSKREQRWAAEQKAAELLVSLAVSVVKARAEIQVAEAQSDTAELKKLRAEVAEMRQLLAARPLPDNAESSTPQGVKGLT